MFDFCNMWVREFVLYLICGCLYVCVFLNIWVCVYVGFVACGCVYVSVCNVVIFCMCVFCEVLVHVCVVLQFLDVFICGLCNMWLCVRVFFVLFIGMCVCFVSVFFHVWLCVCFVFCNMPVCMRGFFNVFLWVIF